ncbi:bifunctional hydroxymethylpyrimidine kinase/phosphomethylpyrimidine kinase [Candidatus Lariskella endosymbiont of Hedychridium roseum]|uniref:bifunctional hydroxymethylpyrimidine kinase/phosphomethylpyrimidine kinase n=1 Tax=Candidatus Lariskella endosymbiont of Hedychridium roseum TaxID=3077949 RepID=UPI0030CC30BC
MKYKCLSIAGFDCSGGAGIQADLKTFSAFGCYGMSILTAMPIQNTCGVNTCFSIPPQSISAQLEVLFEDIIPDSIKIGMLFSSEVIEIVTEFLKQFAKNIPIVLDPVMVARSGDTLLRDTAIDIMKRKLIPLVTVVTPNLQEAYVLAERVDDMESIARDVLMLGPQAVLLKGGRLDSDDSSDLLLERSGNKTWLTGVRVKSNNIHGAGCTLSSAICACLSLGFPVQEACRVAKKYLSEAIEASAEYKIGKGNGPVHHFYHIWPTIHKIYSDNKSQIDNNVSSIYTKNIEKFRRG